MMLLLLSLLLLWSIPSSSFQNVLLPFHQEVNEGCVDEWAEQLGETLDLLRSLRDAGARVNVSCQMGHLAVSCCGWCVLYLWDAPPFPVNGGIMTRSCKKFVLILAIAVTGKGKACQEASSIFQLRGWKGLGCV